MRSWTLCWIVVAKQVKAIKMNFFYLFKDVMLNKCWHGFSCQECLMPALDKS